MKKKILVTGVAGFIGSNLAKRLVEAGYDVVGLDNFSQGIPEHVPSGMRFKQADIRSRDIAPLFRGIDVVFHLAAKNSLRDCQEDPVGTMEMNVVGTANVFDVSLKAGVKKVIYAQSSVVEEGEERRKGFYAISKITDELLAGGFQTMGLTTVGLRYFNVYGPGQDYRRSSPPIMSRFISTLLKGEQPVLFEGDENNKRDFIHVDDINDFHLLCVEDERVDNRVFRLGTGKNFSMVEVLDTVQKVLGTHTESSHKPRPPHDPPVQTLADISETTALGWQPTIGLEEGVRSMVPYIKAEIERGALK
ncbi:MAG: NAD-dependent epimerase/dehydratase family protein [Patescibacteria group bacterium]|mgnify:CR=1 FL=1